ncbi:MAG: apolipoprotein N-acyltransferase, partial [Acidobacteriota bacterium]|nr:apolipoprotein N-acyltransferase [Acidobacteriota bacterium]
MSAFVSVVIAAVGAVAWALCFAATPVVFLPWIALVPLILVSRGRGALWLGLVHGTVFWLLSINWIIATLESYGGLSTTLAIASLLLLSAYLGLYHAVFAWVVSRLWRRSAATLVVALPALWVVLEVVRGFLFSGFPWNLATYSVIEVPGALQLASVVGPYGVSFMVVAVNGAIAVLVTRGWKWRVAGVLASVAALLAVAVLLSPASSDSASGSDVRIIQPNTPILEEWDSERIVDGYRSLMAMSHDACEPGVLLVWPESAAWPYMMGRDLQLDEDIERLTARGCSVIVNSVSRDEGRYFNSAYLLGPENFRSRYDKGHLVPFGEYVPLGRRLPFLKRLARAAGDFSPGATRRQLSWTKDDLGLAICFEIVFPGEVAARVRDGATILVTITNDGWYGDTAA